MKHSIGFLVLLSSCQVHSFCFDDAGAYYNVDPLLLKSIATVESRLRPNATNENHDQSGQVISTDYGIMQINSTWFPRLRDFDVNAQRLLDDPCFNIHIGAWVLSSNFSSHGYNWNSVGAYNAGFSAKTATARQSYIKKVQSVYYGMHR